MTLPVKQLRFDEPVDLSLTLPLPVGMPEAVRLDVDLAASDGRVTDDLRRFHQALSNLAHPAQVIAEDIQWSQSIKSG